MTVREFIQNILLVAPNLDATIYISHTINEDTEEIESFDKMSSVSHPIAFGVICASTAEIIIIIIIIINLIFCFLSNNLYIVLHKWEGNS